MNVIIFANGQLDELTWLDPILSQSSAIIAADGGARHVLRLNLFPDIVIGDMDSLGQDVQMLLKAAGVPMMIHPPEKDETDLELALLYAAEQYEDDNHHSGSAWRPVRSNSRQYLVANPR